VAEAKVNAFTVKVGKFDEAAYLAHYSKNRGRY
jgi:hypothetical protein